MKNFLNKIFVKTIGIANYAKYVLLALSVFGLFGTLATAQISGASSALCVVFNSVRNIIFLLGLTLMILGAALYAGANIMPASAKGGFQGYGMAMIIGGVVGVAIAIAAPFILNLLVGIGGNTSGLLTQTSASQVVTVCGQIGI